MKIHKFGEKDKNDILMKVCFLLKIIHIHGLIYDEHSIPYDKLQYYTSLFTYTRSL